MKLVPRWKLRTLFIIISIAAVGLSFALPFAPSLDFRYSESAYYIAEGHRVETSIVEVTNIGRISIWYPGNETELTNYACEVFGNDLPYRPNGHQSSSATWTRLLPGESCQIEFANTQGQDAIQFRVKLSDWRGRKIDYMSPKILLNLRPDSNRE